MQLSGEKSQSFWFPLILIAPFFLWGTSMVAMKGAISHTSPLFMASIRLLPAGLLVLLFAYWQKRPQPMTLKAWLWILIFGLVDGAMFQGFLAAGLVRTGAGLGSVMIDSQPLAVALLSSWLFGEVIGVWGGIGLAIGIIGISLIGIPDELIIHFLQEHSLPIIEGWQGFSGEGLMLLASLSMAIGTVTIRFVCRYTDAVMATAWHMILGGLVLLLFSGVTESRPWETLNWQDWLSLSYATVFGSAIAYGLFFYIASSSNLTSFSALTFLTPVFALSFGKLFLSETLTSIQWLGVLLTLISIYLINQREKLSQTISHMVQTLLKSLSTNYFSEQSKR